MFFYDSIQNKIVEYSDEEIKEINKKFEKMRKNLDEIKEEEDEFEEFLAKKEKEINKNIEEYDTIAKRVREKIKQLKG